MPKVMKNIKNLRKKFCEFPPCVFVYLGYALTKAEHKTLVKSTLGVFNLAQLF